MKTVIITGSRHWRNAAVIRKVMAALCQEIGPFKFRHGKAKGADSYGAYIAKNVLDIQDIDDYPADWDLHGNAAGPIRNREMLDTEIAKEGKDNIIVIAFPLEDSKGTIDMIEYSRANNIEIRIFDEKGSKVDG